MDHHPSCRPDDVSLILKCNQCGDTESAEEMIYAIITKYLPAIRRDVHEADKVDCHVQSIRGLIIRTMPGRNFT